MKFFLLLAGTAFAAPVLEPRISQISQGDYDELHRAAQLSSAAYSGCSGKAFDVQITQPISDTGTDTQGFVGVDDTNKRISVVMRGSTTPRDILSDIDIRTATPSLSGVTFPDGVEVMQGVLTPWSAVHDTVIGAVRDLQQQHPDYTLEAMGHSLGGALTYLAHIALKQNFPDSTVVSNALNTFPIGNQAFADFGTAQGTLRRGSNTGDGVPNMWPQFTHYGTEYYGPGVKDLTVQCDGQRDLLCSAGDGWITVDPEHIANSGVIMLLAGCG